MVSDFQSLLSGLGPVAERFQQAGHQLYLVGGVVRDHLVNRPAGEPLTQPDIDLTTDARPEETRRLVGPLAEAIWAQGERFGTIGARVAGRDLEITTYRSEAYVGDSRKPTVVFGDDLETDLSRRDFTINAMAVDAVTGELVDPYAGRADLESSLLRTPLDAEVSFADDPLRILRAARFVARFDLEVTPDLSTAARALSHRLTIVSAERKRDELERLLSLQQPLPGLLFLDQHGVVDDLVPELATADRWDRAARRASSANGSLVRRAALLAELPPEALARRLEALRYSRNEAAETARVVELAVEAVDFDGADAEVRRLVLNAGPGAEPELVNAVVTVAQLLTPSAAGTGLAERLAGLRAVEDLTDLNGPLTGAQVMTALDLTPGPAVGEALQRLQEHRLLHGPFGADEALRILRTPAGPVDDPG